MSIISKPQIQKLFCAACESDFKVTYKPEEVSHNPVYCCFCASEIDFDRQDEEAERDAE